MNTPNSAKYILIIEDDPNVGQMLVDVLQDTGYRAVHVLTGAGAKAEVDRERPDLILLDLHLPDTDGLVLCADLYARAKVPIIVVSASSAKRDTILAFKLGADDFIVKPFDVDNLLARVEAKLRGSWNRTAALPNTPRPASATAPPPPREHRVRHAGSLSIDGASRKVRVSGRRVFVTPTEYRILDALLDRVSEVTTRDEIALKVWGVQESDVGRSLDVHIRHLRVKLAEAGPTSPTLTLVRGVGYKMDARPVGDYSVAA